MRLAGFRPYVGNTSNNKPRKRISRKFNDILYFYGIQEQCIAQSLHMGWSLRIKRPEHDHTLY